MPQEKSAEQAPPLQRMDGWPLESGRHAQLFEVNQDNFGGGADAQRRAPGAGAAGGVDEEIPETLEPVGIGAEDARGEPGERKNLAAVRVAGKLQ